MARSCSGAVAAVSLMVLVLLGSCTGAEGEVLVDLRTDMVAGVEFTVVALEIDGRRVARVPALRGESFVAGRRVGQVDGVAAGRHVVAVELRDAVGAFVARREVFVTVADSVGVSVDISRQCRGTVCPSDASDPSHEGCFRGECVGASCIPGADSSCPSRQCDAAADCPAVMTSCAAAQCVEGTCFVTLDDAACEPGQWCDAEEGCTEACVTLAQCASDEVCIDEQCRTSRCGDGVLDPRVGEFCDSADDPRCEECRIRCAADAECDDGDACNGPEACDPGAGFCVVGEAPTCDDGEACTEDICDVDAGCVHRLTDGDGDGVAPGTCSDPSLMGGDCDDADDATYPGALEVCNGRDDDCDGEFEEGTSDVVCYSDADDDGFVGRDAPVAGCSCPTGYRERAGSSELWDCDDEGADAALVFPGQTEYFGVPYVTPEGASSFDYDCDEVETERWPVFVGCSPPPPGGATCVGSGFAEATSCGVVGSRENCAEYFGDDVCLRRPPVDVAQECR